MVRTQISFDEQLYKNARREAKRLGISLAELCRQGLREVLGRSGKESPGWMKHAGTVRSGDPHASASVDAVVYGREEP